MNLMDLDLCSKLGQEHPFAWWWEQPRQPSEHETWYVEELEKSRSQILPPEQRAKAPDVTYLTIDVLMAIERSWSKVSGRQRYPGLIEIPKMIQTALEKTFKGTFLPVPTLKTSLGIPYQISPFEIICQAVKDFLSVVNDLVFAQRFFVGRLSQYGYTTESATLFHRNLLATGMVSQVKALATIPGPIPSAVVDSVATSIQAGFALSPVLLIAGVGFLAYMLTKKSKKRR